MRVVISGGGITVILLVLGILGFILFEASPLVSGTSVTVGPRVAGPESPLLAIAENEHRSHRILATRDGMLSVLADSGLVSSTPLREGLEPPLLDARFEAGLVLARTARSVVARIFDWEDRFEGLSRRVAFVPGPTLAVAGDEPVLAYHGSRAGDGSSLLVAATATKLHFVRLTLEEDLVSGEMVANELTFSAAISRPASWVRVDRDHRSLYAVDGSNLTVYQISGQSVRQTAVVASPRSSPITAVELLLGDRALVVGHESGHFDVWFRTQPGQDDGSLRPVHEFDPLPSAVRRIITSPRERSFLCVTNDGIASLCYSTNRRHLWSGELPREAPLTSLFYSPKANGFLMSDAAGWYAADLRNPHPEASLGSYFAKVHYEDYPEPAYVWQSTGGGVEAEKKLSLVPLILGTMKGTFFSLILAVPLAVLAALFASHYLHPSILRIVKPVVEIMAALPSVVLGLVAALWLAPRVKAFLPGLGLLVLILPLALIATGAMWSRRPKTWVRRWLPGVELIPYALTTAGVAAGCFALAAPLEEQFFFGDIQVWLASRLGLPFDQGNAIVVGLAMGFTVIPLVFTISEEAFSSVPKPLVSASLALGANRWQTVSRVVLPMASPGVFSAVMVGFGRAVGETIIVVMATGNTPITDWNPFNGFRTLSANIAVEIPEAAHGDTLYRTLFLAAVILFLLTFTVNTAADVIRQRIRKRYALL